MFVCVRVCACVCACVCGLFELQVRNAAALSVKSTEVDSVHSQHSQSPESPHTHTHTHTGGNASHKHKLPASINSSSCKSHLCERLNRNKWLIWPGAEAWQETDCVWPGDPRTEVTTAETGTTVWALVLI